MAQKKYVYSFKEAHQAKLGKPILGGKGFGLAEMTAAGINIPQGFTVTTEACTLYYESGKKIPDFVWDDVVKHIHDIEKSSGKSFGGGKDVMPLLVSVRSGARESMPGMMDTILNLGLNDEVVVELAKQANNERFAWDSYRRFILMYTNIAKGHPRTEMDKMLDKLKEENGYKLDTEVTTEQLKALVAKYKEYYKGVFGEEFPTDPYEQLKEAIAAVFRSWDNPRANVYRQMHGIPYEWGTAVNVQTMVFGNMGNDSGTGVAFSRNPSTGEKKVYAEFLLNAQGEDVVVRTPEKIEWLEKNMPEVYKQFEETITKMEAYFKDMQDMEYTVEKGTLYFLQTRNGKRTAAAALKIACDLVDEGLIDEKTAVLRVDPMQLNDLLHPTFNPADLKKHTPIFHGLPASPGAGTGHLVFTADEAKAEKEAGRPVVMVRAETSPEDIIGMVNAEAIVTARGGMTSHAAVVARSMGKCCVAGCSDIIVNEEEKTLTVHGKTYTEKDVFSVNGTTGEVFEGAIEMQPADLGGNFGRMMAWADKYRRLKVRVNANTPEDAANGRKFGAEGIGLCRTERMFFAPERILNMRAMILSDTTEQRETALEKIRPFLMGDFYQMYMANPDSNVNIRFLDPPLHEFLPEIHDEENIKALAAALNVSEQKVKDRINQLHQANPMMGFRGVRLCVAYPEIYAVLAKAIIQAAVKASKELGHDVEPEIMIPLCGELKEYNWAKKVVVEAVEKEMAAEGKTLKYKVGTMIEIPRGALRAGDLAKEAEFFSFGTNDLTQLTMGFSRDDSGQFLPYYYDRKIYEFDPFQTIDVEGVGELVKIAVERGRATNPNLLIGVCGETGGDPRSIEFYDAAGLDYVSCSPFRIPLARLAAAQAALKHAK